MGRKNTGKKRCVHVHALIDAMFQIHARIIERGERGSTKTLSSSMSTALLSSLTYKGRRRLLLLPGKDGETAGGRRKEDKRLANYYKEEEKDKEEEEGKLSGLLGMLPGRGGDGGRGSAGCGCGGNRRKSAHVVLSYPTPSLLAPPIHLLCPWSRAPCKCGVECGGWSRRNDE